MNALKLVPPATKKANLARQTQELKRNLETPIQAPRIALERKISLRFPHFQGFLTEYSSNISITGMFVRSREPQPPGTVLDFEFSLIDGLKLIHGTGEVIWERSRDEGPELPAGMGIRFLRLDAESRRLIRWAVEKQIYDGVEPFDLESYKNEAEATIVTAPGSGDKVDAGRLYSYAGYATAKRPPRKLLWAAAGLLAALPLVLVLIWTYPTGQTSPAAHARDEVAQAAVETEPLSSNATTAAAAADPVETVIRATETWARAWAEQRPDDYLRHYSRSFHPPRGQGRSEWESQRKSRISRPRFIQVAISGLEAELLGPDRARVSFDQDYRSDSFQDAMRKTLELVREDGEWKILEERAAS